MSKADLRLPSDLENARYWIKAFASHCTPGNGTGLPGTDGGKWLLYPGEWAAADDMWKIIRAAVWRSELGHHAQVSTRRAAALWARRRPGLTPPVGSLTAPQAAPGDTAPATVGPVIEVYTADHHDRADLRRTLGALRELGITGEIPYKTNAATRAGATGPASVLYVSPAGAKIRPGPGPASVVHQLDHHRAAR